MRADNLEEAIQYRDRLKELQTFKRGLIDQKWGGPVECTFGGYKVTLTMKCTYDLFVAAVLAEEKMLVNTLEMMGVEV